MADLSFRDKDWLKTAFPSTGIQYIDEYNDVIFKREGDVYYLYYSGMDSDSMAVYNVVIDEIVLLPAFYSAYPTCHKDASTSQKVRDFIDVVWWYKEGRKLRSTTFRKADSGRSIKSTRLMKARLATPFNSTTHNLLQTLRRESHSIQEAIFGQGNAIYSDNLSLYTIQPVGTLINIKVGGSQQRGSATEYHYVYKNMGYFFHDESQSWWHESEKDSRGRVTAWERMKPVACSECGTMHLRDELIDGVCTVCLGVSRDDIKIHSYSTRVPGILEFKGKVNKNKPKFSKEGFNDFYNKYHGDLGLNSDSYDESAPLYLGLELEYESSNTDKAALSTMKYLKGHAILKSDGSIRSGFEIVTCPATIDEHVKVFQPFFEGFPKTLQAKSNCGLHVHVSRKPLSLLTQGKMIEFMNRQDNVDFIKSIAGRWSSQYAPNDVSRKITHVWRGGGARYNTLNTSNKATLEFRIFEAVTKWEDFIPKIEFCVALTEYCKPCVSQAPLKEVTNHKEFIKWMKGQQQEFPNFFSWLFKDEIAKRQAKQAGYAPATARQVLSQEFENSIPF